MATALARYLDLERESDRLRKAKQSDAAILAELGRVWTTLSKKELEYLMTTRDPRTLWGDLSLD